MTGLPFSFSGADLVARPSGALWWPHRRLLCAADLHLCKSERLARRGGPLLPPYETAATIDRLVAEVAALDPALVVALGDSFDDCTAGRALATSDLGRLTALIAARTWVWIAGNHDPAPLELPGNHCEELAIGPLVFRHRARVDAAPGEVSGHWHPKHRLALSGGTVSRPCFLVDRRRLILPAFGAYTGGVRSDHSALAALLARPSVAMLTGEPMVVVPLSRTLAMGPGRATLRILREKEPS